MLSALSDVGFVVLAKHDGTRVSIFQTLQWICDGGADTLDDPGSVGYFSKARGLPPEHVPIMKQHTKTAPMGEKKNQGTPD